MWPFGGKKDRTQQFWEWFAENASALTEPTEATISALSKRMAAADKDLTWEVGTNKEGVHELVVSADGIRERIPKVQAFVAAAPQISGWKIHAFRQRMEGVGVQFEGNRLDAESIHFVARKTPPTLSLQLYIPGLPSNPGVIGAAFLLLDATIGEYDVMTKIGEIEPLPYEQAPQGSKPLSALRDEVDAMSAVR